MSNEKGKPTSIYLDDDVKSVADMLARSKKLSRSKVINAACRAYFVAKKLMKKKALS
jgi:predicted transcriptional regulator